jgi:hypothetical protein
MWMVCELEQKLEKMRANSLEKRSEQDWLASMLEIMLRWENW